MGLVGRESFVSPLGCAAMGDSYSPVDSPDETTIFPYHDLTPPAPRELFAAANHLSQYLTPTPLVRSAALSDALDADVYLKRDDTLPTGAFKVRGGLHLLGTLPSEFRDPGVIAASTGNHGQSIAYAGDVFDVPVVIAVPEDANPSKVRAMERLGATAEHVGRDYDEAREWVEREATEVGYRYVHSANEPQLVAGVGTAGLEVVRDLPDLDYAFVPVGGGSCAAGYCLSVGAIGDAAVVGVQSEAAPGMHRAWRDDHLKPHDQMDTFAEGLATSVPFALTQQVLRERLDAFLTVSDEALKDAMATLLAEERIVVEGAGAASLAGAIACSDRIEGSTVVLQLSGRNVDIEKLVATVERAQ